MLFVSEAIVLESYKRKISILIDFFFSGISLVPDASWNGHIYVNSQSVKIQLSDSHNSWRKGPGKMIVFVS
jgi:hypothetical protein